MRSAVFIQNHGKVVAVLLHVAEQNVCFHAFRHEKHLAHGLLHYVLARKIGQAQIYFCVEHTDDVVDALLADGIEGIGRAFDGLIPFRNGFVVPEERDFRAVRHDFTNGQVVELKHVLDHFAFFGIDYALFAAAVHQHADLLLRNLAVLCIGVNAKEAQKAVGGNGQQPYDGGEQLGNERDEPGERKAQGFRFLHRKALGHKLAEHQRKVGKDQRDEHHGN